MYLPILRAGIPTLRLQAGVFFSGIQYCIRTFEHESVTYRTLQRTYVTECDFLRCSLDNQLSTGFCSTMTEFAALSYEEHDWWTACATLSEVNVVL